VPEGSGQPASLSEWVSVLNKWAHQQVTAWASVASWDEDAALTTWAIRGQGGYGHSQPGSGLLQYGMGWTPQGEVNPTVVYRNWVKDSGEPHGPTKIAAQKLRAAGITQVVCGHKPVGDVPMVIQDLSGITIVDADTTYSANVLGIDQAKSVQDPVTHTNSKRSPCAATEVYHCGGRTVLHGITADGEYCEAQIGDGVVGKSTPEGWWARTVRRKDGYVRLTKMEGYKVNNMYVNPQEAKRQVGSSTPKL